MYSKGDVNEILCVQLLLYRSFKIVNTASNLKEFGVKLQHVYQIRKEKPSNETINLCRSWYGTSRVPLFSCCCCCISSLRPLLRLEIPQTTLKELTRCLYMFV